MSNTIQEITYIHFKQGINLLLKDWESFEELLRKKKEKQKLHWWSAGSNKTAYIHMSIAMQQNSSHMHTRQTLQLIWIFKNQVDEYIMQQLQYTC